MTNGPIPPIFTPVAPPVPSGQVVQIQTLPDALQNITRAMRIEGEVIQQNKDGSIRVRTPQGDIDLNIRGKQPQAGQRLEVDIPAGNPPRNVTVRTPPPPPQTPQPQAGQTAPPPAPNVAPAQPPATTPSTTAPPSQTKPSPDVVITLPPDKPPLDGRYQPPVAGTKPTIPAGLPSLNAGQTVRLSPLQEILAPTGTAAPTSMADQMAFKAGLSAQKTEGGLVTSLLQAMKSALPPGIMASIPGLTPTGIKPEMAAPQLTLLPHGATASSPLNTGSSSIPGLPGMNENAAMSPLPAGTVLEAKIMAIKNPSGQTQIFQTPTNNSANTNGTNTGADGTMVKPQTVTVTVTGFTPQKMPIIAMPLSTHMTTQNFVLQAYAPMLQTGSQLTLAPQTPQGTALSSLSNLPPAWRAMLPLMQPSPFWPLMDDLFQTFLQTTPQAAQILGRVIPSPGNPANMGPAMMLFAAALKSGDLQAWMGDKKLEMLQKLGKGALITGLANETSALARIVDAPGNEWRSFPIPMLWQNEISKVLFHVRKEPSDDDKNPGDFGTRFLFDLDLTRMGSVQLDGLLRGNRLDLIVRTKDAISHPMQEAMKKAYADALTGTDIYGELGFQGDLKNWMVVTRENEIGIDL